MKIAIIDCGTNTFNLLVLDISSGGLDKQLLSTRESVKLGEGAINSGYIAKPAFERAVQAFQLFHEAIESLEVDKVLAYATSAVRDASNGWQLVAGIKEKFGITIEIINGLDEAKLIFLGVNAAVKLNEQVSLMMDIGGGSVEFILANKSGLLWKESFNIGVARILEQVKPSDPICDAEISMVREFLNNNLRQLSEAVKQFKPTELIGSSGVFESLVNMLAAKNLSEPITDQQTEYPLNCEHYFSMSNEIIHATLGQRRVMPGLVSMRVDMIVISCLMLNYVLEEYHLKHIRVSTYSLKEGAVINFINALNTTNNHGKNIGD
jgi:exopolyphosphatase/guanosine-5'-triphosphate,3'-diphosphate pyrophosphatase